MVINDNNKEDTVITLLPNRSLSWQETRLFLFLICGTTLAIGVFWAFVGVWAVLPFSGLEALLVTWVMYRVCQSTYQRQVITIGKDGIKVQFGASLPERSWTLQANEAHLTVTEAEHHLAAPTLVIGDREQRIEVGNFLSREDKALALSSLQEAGLRVRSVYRESHQQM